MPDRAAPISAPPYTYIMKTLIPRRMFRRAILKISLVYIRKREAREYHPLLSAF